MTSQEEADGLLVDVTKAVQSALDTGRLNAALEREIGVELDFDESYAPPTLDVAASTSRFGVITLHDNESEAEIQIVVSAIKLPGQDLVVGHPIVGGRALPEPKETGF